MSAPKLIYSNPGILKPSNQKAVQFTVSEPFSDYQQLMFETCWNLTDQGGNTVEVYNDMVIPTIIFGDQSYNADDWTIVYQWDEFVLAVHQADHITGDFVVYSFTDNVIVEGDFGIKAIYGVNPSKGGTAVLTSLASFSTPQGNNMDFTLSKSPENFPAIITTIRFSPPISNGTLNINMNKMLPSSLLMDYGQDKFIDIGGITYENKDSNGNKNGVKDNWKMALHKNNPSKSDLSFSTFAGILGYDGSYNMIDGDWGLYRVYGVSYA